VPDATQALKKVTRLLVEAFVNVRGEGNPSGRQCCSFKDSDEHPFLVVKGNLNTERAKNWLMNLEELLQAMNCTEEQRIRYTTYNL